MTDTLGNGIAVVSDVSLGFGSPQVQSMARSLVTHFRAPAMIYEPDSSGRPPVTLEGEGIHVRRITTDFSPYSSSGRIQYVRRTAECLNQERPAIVVIFCTFALPVLARLNYRPRTVIYSLISYKTTWCLLNFWLGVILLAGIGASALVQMCRTRLTRILLVALLGVGVLHLALQSWTLSQYLAADLRNPYVYAQTSAHVRELVQRVEAISQVAPEGHETVVKVIAPESYWPLPWYLRQFQHVGWYEELPADPFAPIILASAKLGAALDDKSDKRYIMTGYYELRPKVFLELYVERGLWEKFVATLPRDVD